MTGLGLMLPTPAAAAAAASSSDRVTPARILEVLRELYGEELAPVLLALGQVESNLDPLARNQSSVEDSRGIWQVNTKAWGVDAAPSSLAVYGTLDRLMQGQARAMRPVVEDALAGARELAQVGAPLGDAFNLIWQYGRGGARRIVSGIARWTHDAVRARIEDLYDAGRAAAWAARQAAFTAAWRAAAGIVLPAAAAAGAGVLFTLLLFLGASRMLARRR